VIVWSDISKTRTSGDLLRALRALCAVSDWFITPGRTRNKRRAYPSAQAGNHNAQPAKALPKRGGQTAQASAPAQTDLLLVQGDAAEIVSM